MREPLLEGEQEPQEPQEPQYGMSLFPSNPDSLDHKIARCINLVDFVRYQISQVEKERYFQ